MFAKHAKLKSLLKAKLREAGLLKKLRAGELKFPDASSKSTLFAVPDSLKNVRGLTPDDLAKIKKHHYGRAAARNPDKGFAGAVSELGEKGVISEGDMIRLINEHPHWANLAQGLQAKGLPTKSLGVTAKDMKDHGPGVSAFGEVVTRDLVKGLGDALKPIRGKLQGKKININIRSAGEPHLRVVK